VFPASSAATACDSLHVVWCRPVCLPCAEHAALASSYCVLSSVKNCNTTTYRSACLPVMVVLAAVCLQASLSSSLA
jgi:hypothetical protein